MEPTLVTPTEHPYIVRVAGVAGGRPVIRGTRISVEFIIRQLRTGDSPEDIVDPYPHLSLAAVYDALSYYYDHEDEIEIEPSIPDLGQVDERLGFSIDTPAPPCTFGDHGR